MLKYNNTSNNITVITLKGLMLRALIETIRILIIKVTVMMTAKVDAYKWEKNRKHIPACLIVSSNDFGQTNMDLMLKGTERK